MQYSSMGKTKLLDLVDLVTNQNLIKVFIILKNG